MGAGFGGPPTTGARPLVPSVPGASSYQQSLFNQLNTNAFNPPPVPNLMSLFQNFQPASMPQAPDFSNIMAQMQAMQQQNMSQMQPLLNQMTAPINVSNTTLSPADAARFNQIQSAQLGEANADFAKMSADTAARLGSQGRTGVSTLAESDINSIAQLGARRAADIRAAISAQELAAIQSNRSLELQAAQAQRAGLGGAVQALGQMGALNMGMFGQQADMMGQSYGMQANAAGQQNQLMMDLLRSQAGMMGQQYGLQTGAMGQQQSNIMDLLRATQQFQQPQGMQSGGGGGVSSNGGQMNYPQQQGSGNNMNQILQIQQMLNQLQQSPMGQHFSGLGRPEGFNYLNPQVQQQVDALMQMMHQLQMQQGMVR